MSISQAQKTPWVRGFVGEDINNLPSMIPPNVAQDARNTDYYRGTVLKRNGFLRLDDRPMTNGGISIRLNNVTPGNIGNISWAPAKGWVVSMVVQMEKASCSGSPKILRCGTPATDGFNIYYDVANDRFVAEIESSGGTKVLAQANSSYTTNQIVALMLIYYVSEGGTKYYRFYQDTTLVSSDHAADTYSAPGAPVLRWAYNNAAQTVKFWMDEVRIYEFDAEDTAYAALISTWGTDLGYLRELTTAEQADSHLVKYYKFGTDKFVFASGFSADDGASTFSLPFPTLGVGVYTKENTMARGLVCGHYDTDLPRCTAITLWASGLAGVGEFWIQCGSEIFAHVNQSGTANSLYASRVAEFRTVGSGAPDGEAWSLCRYRNRLVAVHPRIGCFHIGIPTSGYSDLQFKALVPIRPDPTVGPVVASDSGAGAGPGAGTYLFKFFYRNSITGVHSASNTTPLSVVMAGANAIQLDPVTTLFGLRRPLDGADYIDIFRTKAGGATYYLMESVALSAAPTTPHNTAAINLADASIAETNSEINLRYYLADRTPLRARAAFEHRGLLVLVAPNEDGGYSAATNFRNVHDSAIMWSDPLAIHLFSTDNYKEVLPDVSDYLTGGISVIGGALLAKRYSMVAAYGENLGQASYRHISHTIGCLAHNSISSSDEYVYWLSDKGIARCPVSLQTGSVKLVQQERFKPLFDDIDPARVGMACGVYWALKQQYWCSFDTVSNGRVTLVFNERANAIARYDHEIEAFYVYASNDPTVADHKLVGSWRGYRVELDSGQTDGADINATTITVTGTVTSADAQSLTDSGQAWGLTTLYGPSPLQDPYARLAGLKITVTDDDDPTISQTRTIYCNSATRLWVETPWDWTPDAGDTFVIAGINWYWKSGLLCPHGNPGEKEHGLRMRFLQTKQASADNVDLDVWVDDVASTDARVLTTNTRRREFLVNTRGYEVEFQLSNDDPNAPFELEAFQVDLQEAKVRG